MTESSLERSERAELPLKEAIATGGCLVLGLVGFAGSQLALTPDAKWVRAVYAGAYLAGGFFPLQGVWSALRQRSVSVDLLMILAAVGAAVIGDWGEGVALLFLFSLSGALEAFATYRTTRSIESLIQLRPREAIRVASASDEGRRVPIDELQVSDLVRVRPGDRFPVDGVVVDGETWADEATLTGESESIHKPIGADVYSGTINGTGTVLVRMTKIVADSTLARIVHMVQTAQAQKTPTQQFVESWQPPYVIGVIAAALMTMVGMRVVHTSSWSDAFYHAMVLLVAASPCAVVVSSPSVMLSAIARAGRHGVMFKGGIHVESLGKIDVLAMDKTGTVTVGRPRVIEIWTPHGTDERRLLSLAAALERRSEHPLSASILDAVQERGIEPSSQELTDFHSHTGLGVHARIGGTWIGVGREGLFSSHEVVLDDQMLEQAERMRQQGQTALLLRTMEEDLCGVVGVADPLRPEAAETLAALKQLGVRHTVILTGDHERVARVIAERLRADDVRAGLMPEQKVTELRKLTRQGQGVAMVGDGVNDAPALATARVGIAMGGAGTDVALEVADVVLMRDDLRALPFAFWISRRANQRVRQNMVFAFSMIAVLVLSSFFNLPLWLGVLGHEGSTVLVVFNGLRLLWEKPPTF